MKKHLEKILASILLSTSVLLGLSFWLNTKFSFNIFYAKHWDKLAKLQVSHAPVNNIFYISIGVAIFIFIFGLYIIFRPRFRRIFKKNPKNLPPQPQPEQNSQALSANEQETPPVDTPISPTIMLKQPPKLNLPKNIAILAKQHYEEQQNNIAQQQTESANAQNTPNTQYDAQLDEIFKTAGYLVKPAIKYGEFTSSLFAIGYDEQAWLGGVDCDINALQNATTKLKSIFEETLDDIPINLVTFMLDTQNKYDSTETILVLHDIEDVKHMVENNPNPQQPESSDQENFNAYSDYIDTIVQYIKNL